ncbi:MAG: signal peptidase II [Chloroflexota bacterium]
MPRANSPRNKRWRAAFFATALLIIACDQLSKLWIRTNLAFGQSLPPEGGFFRLEYTHNSGAAFGLFQGQSLPLTILALISAIFLLSYAPFIYRRLPVVDNRLGSLALGLVLGGTVGNLIDRLHLGYVTDFIGIGIWPTFNIADSSIVVSAIILAYLIITRLKPGNADLAARYDGKGT